MALAPQLLFTLLISCCFAPYSMMIAHTDPHSFFDAHVEFSPAFNVAAVRKSSLHNATAVSGFTLILSITLPQRHFAAYMSANAVDIEASVLCLTPLLPSSVETLGAAAQSGRCYPLQSSDNAILAPPVDSEFCWGEGEHELCRARFGIPCHMIIPGDVQPQYITYTLNASIAFGSKLVYVREPVFYLAFFDGNAEHDGVAVTSSGDVDINVTSSAAPPHVTLDRTSRSHLQFLDAVYTSWPTQPCPRLFSRWAHWTRGLRFCLLQHCDNSAVSVFWIGASSEQLAPGLGLPSVAGSGGSVYAMDCDSAATVPLHTVEAIRDIDGSVLHRSHEWSWRFLPWCLLLSPDLIFSPSSSFNPVYAANHASFNLSQSTPPTHLTHLTRTRGGASIAAMHLILNVSSHGHRIVRLDIGCRGWVVLLHAASPDADNNWWPANGSLQLVARLPVGHAVKDDAASWECAPVLQELGVAAEFQRLLPLQAYLKQFYNVVAWDHLSVSSISVTLLAVHPPTAATPVAAALPPKCSLGNVDVCDVCKDSETAEDCLPPQLLHYLTTIGHVCARLSPPCPGIIKMAGSSAGYKLVLSDSPTLRRIVHWSLLQRSILQGLPSMHYNTVVTSHQTGAGLGNVWHSTMSALVLALVENAPLLVSFDIHPDSKKGRWEGLFSQAVDMGYGNRVFVLTQRWSSGVERVVDGPGPEADDFWACDWGRVSANESNVAGSGKVLSLRGGSFPLLALANDAHGHELLNLFGHNMDFYLSHFLVSAAPALRDTADAFMKGMRLRSAFIIGVHMRWVTNHAGEQYLIPEDFHQFVQSAATIAASHSSVGIYIASDSAAQVSRLIDALRRLNQSWQVQSAPVGSYTSDGSTFDALFDALVLGQCDDFIATAGSTFSHFAAALGAHLPVVIGGSVYSHGRSRSNTYRVDPGNYIWGIGFTGVKNTSIHVPWYTSKYLNATSILELDFPSCTDQTGDALVGTGTINQAQSVLETANSSRRARVQARILDLAADSYQLYQNYSSDSVCQHQRFCV
jgi:hypothetical protein